MTFLGFHFFLHMKFALDSDEVQRSQTKREVYYCTFIPINSLSGFLCVLKTLNSGLFKVSAFLQSTTHFVRSINNMAAKHTIIAHFKVNAE